VRALRTAVVSTTAALALAFAGVATPAGADEDPYPESDGWMAGSSDRVLPAGSACKVKILEHNAGHLRLLQISKRVVFQDFGEDSRTTYTNPKNGKTVTVNSSGDGLTRSSKSGKTVRITALGGSTFQGRGIRGIVYANGVQKLKITRAGTKKEILHLKIVNGTRKQVCRQLGTKPVKGKNVVIGTPDPGGSGSGS
jgi:hypothetical protein